MAAEANMVKKADLARVREIDFTLMFEESIKKLAEALGLQVSGAWARVNGKTDFRASEIEKIRERYNLSDADLVKIFFTSVVS